MTTEKAFSHGHSAFWSQLLPASEPVVRDWNAGAARFCDALDSSRPPSERGVVNEAGFRIFAAATERGLRPAELSAAAIDRCIHEAVGLLSGLSHLHGTPVEFPGAAALAEAQDLATRLQFFFRRATPSTLTVSPVFSGCGWLDECRGDVLAGSVLFEVKAGDRGFRSADLRQLLCYSALNFASKTYELTDICLVNPRAGRYLTESLDGLCQQLAGRSSAEVLADIVDYVSEPTGRYATG